MGGGGGNENGVLNEEILKPKRKMHIKIQNSRWNFTQKFSFKTIPRY